MSRRNTELQQMNRAMAELKRMYGKAAGWRINRNAPTPEERAAAKAALPGLQEQSRLAKDAAEARRRELLQDPEYVRLLAVKKAADDERDRTAGLCRSVRITVGKISSIFFQVTGEGDTWEEALEQARKAKS